MRNGVPNEQQPKIVDQRIDRKIGREVKIGRIAKKVEQEREPRKERQKGKIWVRIRSH